ncbi:MAG: hypothetical protein HZA60_10035 [Deltaproteobacteria bacterium]|nr:hypothetical protein [Deltaproteobacteria bacterium]
MERVLHVGLRTVTPLFPDETDPAGESVLSSVIGNSLRFWWRYLECLRVGGGGDRILSEERRIFGGPEGRSGIMEIRWDPGKVRVAKAQDASPAYREFSPDLALLAEGLVKERPLPTLEREVRAKARKPTRVYEPSRDFVDAREPIAFDVTFSGESKPDDPQRLYEALWAWCHLGGSGILASKGWGSLRLESPGNMAPPPAEGNLPYLMTENLRKELAGILAGPGGQDPGTRDAPGNPVVMCPHVADSWPKAVDWAGAKIRAYSRRGREEAAKEEARARLTGLFSSPPSAPSPESPREAPGGVPRVDPEFFRRPVSKAGPWGTEETVPEDAESDESGDLFSLPFFIHFHAVATGRVAVIFSCHPALRAGSGEERMRIVHAAKRFFSFLSTP